MCTIATAKVQRNYNRHNVYFNECLHITFVRSVSEGYVFAEAKELVNHRRMPFAEVRITDESGNLLAIFTSSGYRKEDCPIVL